MNVRPSLLILTTTVVATALLSTVSQAEATSAPASRTTIANTAPTGQAAYALTHGAVAAPSGQVVTFQVQLRLRDESAAESLATAVSTPGTTSYGHYLSPAEFNARFAPTVTQTKAVTSFLASYGITDVSMPANRRFIVAQGTVTQVSKAFAVQMRAYVVDGRRYLTDTTAVSVPSSLAPTILTVTGLNETGGAKPGLIGKDSGTSAAAGSTPAREPIKTPCSQSWGAHYAKLPPAYGSNSFPTSICGYTPAQLQSAYGMQSSIAQGRTGKGVTVAIIDAYTLPTMEADANRYFAHYGEAGFAPGQFSEVLPKSYRLQDACNEASWQPEEALDVESVHGLAPGAHITYVAGKSCSYQGLLTPLNTIVNNHLADIVSNSWGLFNESSVPTSWLSAYH